MLFMPLPFARVLGRRCAIPAHVARASRSLPAFAGLTSLVAVQPLRFVVNFPLVFKTSKTQTLFHLMAALAFATPAACLSAETWGYPMEKTA